MSGRVWFEGVTEVGRLAADLSGASEEVAVRGLKLVQETARTIRDDARGLAPVRTGGLRRSITYRTTGPLEAEVGPTKFTAHFVEFGTSKMAPQPYMGPATDANEGPFAEACEKLAGDALEGR